MHVLIVVSLQVLRWWTGWCSCSWLWPVWRPWRWPRRSWTRASYAPLAWRVPRLCAPAASASSSWTTLPLCTALWVHRYFFTDTLTRWFKWRRVSWISSWRRCLIPVWQSEEERQREGWDVAVCGGTEWEGDKERLPAQTGKHTQPPGTKLHLYFKGLILLHQVIWTSFDSSKLGVFCQMVADELNLFWKM